MGKYSGLSGQKIITVLERMGFEKARQRGSHVVMRKKLPGSTIGCVVPLHKEVAPGTLHVILKQAQISMQEFENFM